MLGDGLGFVNSYDWIFISNEQKGLVNVIESLFEHAEHRTHLWHLYNSTSAQYKALGFEEYIMSCSKSYNGECLGDRNE